MARGSGLGGLLAILGLALIFSGPRKKPYSPGGYSYYQSTGIMPHVRVIQEMTEENPQVGEDLARARTLWPVYPQVTTKTRIDPRTPQYQEVLEEKYPEELEATRVAYQATRKAIGLREYHAPPMPRTSRGRR